MKTFTTIAVALFFAARAQADIFPSSSISASADVERVSREQKGTQLLTTRVVKVKLQNMSPVAQQTVGVECWFFYRDLRSEQIALQHEQRSVCTLASGESRELVADKVLFEYTPDQFKAFGHGRHGIVKHIPGSGHKYFGFVVRIFENGRVTNEISSSSRLTSIVDEKPADTYGGGAIQTRPYKR